MRQIFHIFLSLTLASSLVLGVDFERLMSSGNTYYTQGSFDKAIQEYEKILAADGTSATLHYNLGCAYFNQKSYGKAILHFEKARLLNPRDPDILHNLEFSKLFIKDRFELPKPMPVVVWFNTLRRCLSLAELRRLELILFSLTILGFMAYIYFRNRYAGQRILLATWIVTGLFIVTVGWLWDRGSSGTDTKAVLLVEEANIASAPVPGSGTLFIIHEGTTAEILNTTDSWYEIRLPDGKTGWVLHEAVGIF